MQRWRLMLAAIAWFGSVLLSGCPMAPPPVQPDTHGDTGGSGGGGGGNGGGM